MIDKLPLVDHKALQTNQAAIITFLIAAFIFDSPGLLVFVTLTLAVGVILRKPGFEWLSFLLRKGNLVQPDRLRDYPDPHRFSQGIGAAFTFLAWLLVLGGWNVLGWSASWLVILLAGLNLWGGFCLGCALYFWLNRLGVHGFVKTAPPGSRPGRKPVHPAPPDVG